MSETNINSEINEIKSNETQEKLKQKVEVTLGDIQVIANIIDVATQRGAFRAPELKGIGEYYEKIMGILSTLKE